MPQVATGKYVWQRFKNVWANPTATTYTTPVLEQIAESVKEVIDKQAEYKQTLDEVSNKLTQTTTTANETKTQVSKNKQTIDSMSTTLTSTTKTANEAKSQSSTNKQTIDSMSTTLTQTTTTANNALNKATTAQQNLDGFKTTVSNTYTTKADFNNLTIGGRNLLKDSKTLTKTGGTGTDSSTIWIVGNTGSEGFKKFYINTTSTNWIECQIPLYAPINTLTQNLTISFEYRESVTGLLVFNFSTHKANGGRIKELTNWVVSTDFKTLGNSDNWKQVSFTFNPSAVNNQTDASEYRVQFKKASGKTGECQVRKFKLEIGNKATDWTPAPEDIDNAITTVDNKFANYSTTTQMNSSITQKANEITSSVSETYVTKANANNTYATKSALSEVKQTADGLTTEVSKKLNSADLSSRIQQSATDIRIGFNGINNYISISDAMGIRVNHTDGSFSRINEDGFLHYNSGTGRRYHSLYTGGTIELTGTGENEHFTITLPSIFSKVDASDIILILSMDGPRLWASDGVYSTEYFSVSNWIDVTWTKNSSGCWTTSDISAHYKARNTATKKSEYLKAYITYLVLA